ncbi:MAG: hypothetical protein ACQEXX_01445 [Bacillota bacterium]
MQANNCSFDPKLLRQMIEEIKVEEELATKIEKESNLTYYDGQKVMIGDVFIEEDRRESSEDSPYGKTSYVYRINEDGAIDNCFSSNFAWKANNYPFDSSRSRLIRRNGKLQNPLWDEEMFLE